MGQTRTDHVADEGVVVTLLLQLLLLYLLLLLLLLLACVHPVWRGSGSGARTNPIRKAPRPSHHALTEQDAVTGPLAEGQRARHELEQQHAERVHVSGAEGRVVVRAH